MHVVAAALDQLLTIYAPLVIKFKYFSDNGMSLKEDQLAQIWKK